MAVVSPAACAMGRKGERGKGPASYRGLGLRPAVAGLPSHLPWPPKVAAGSGLPSGPLAPAFSGPFISCPRPELSCEAMRCPTVLVGPPVLLLSKKKEKGKDKGIDNGKIYS